MRHVKLVLICVVALLLIAGCATPAPTATPLPPPTVVPSAVPPKTALPQPTAVPPTKTSGSTVGQLANLGQAVFTRSCVRCHGDKGQGGSGSALIGTQAQLSRYTNALGLLDKMRTTMPRGAPGSLSAEEYLQLLAFLLQQNNVLQANAPLDSSGLASIVLPK